jgi:hypothetical protein
VPFKFTGKVEKLTIRIEPSKLTLENRSGSGRLPEKRLTGSSGRTFGLAAAWPSGLRTGATGRVPFRS